MAWALAFMEPAAHLRPHVMMSPFSLDELTKRREQISHLPLGDVHFIPPELGPDNAAHSEIRWTRSGREAIDLALRQLRLKKGDEVLIWTTSGGEYISGCVAQTIERHCEWSRELTRRTKAILTIHEFGFTSPLPRCLEATGLPIIADCAYALGATLNGQHPGYRANFIVYSFSKAFPLPMGGALVGPSGMPPSSLELLAQKQLSALIQSHFLPSLPAIVVKRRHIWSLYQAAFSAHSLGPLMLSDFESAAPHAFILALNEEVRAIGIKKDLNDRGIECSVYFGGGGFFLPCHQSLSLDAVEYIVHNFLTSYQCHFT